MLQKSAKSQKNEDETERILYLKTRNNFRNVLLQNVVFDDVEYKLYVFCVRGAGEVGVNVRRPHVVHAYEHLRYKLSRTDVVTFGP